MAIRGKVIVVGQTESGVSKTGKNWKKQLYVLETEGQYPKKVAFYILNDKIEQAAIQLGQTVECEIDIESREYNGKWYTNNGTAWKVNNIGFVQQPVHQAVYQQTAPQGYEPSVTPTNQFGQPLQQSQSDGGDLPF